MSRILISYRREDSAHVTGRIYDRLVQQFGRTAVFKDVDSIPLGIDFRIYLDQQVAKCDVFLSVIGRNWMKPQGQKGKSRLADPADFVRLEIEAALKRQIPVIPVLVEGASIPSVDRLPASMQSLSYRNGIVVRPDPDFHRDMDRLIEHLLAQIEREQEHLPSPDVQHTASDVSSTAEAARSEVKGPGQENVEVAVPPSSPESQPMVTQLQEETPVAFPYAHSTVRDGSEAAEEVRSENEPPGQERIDAAVPFSEADSQQRTVEQGEEELAASSAASPTPTDGFPSYLLGGIGLIILIGTVAAFLILQPKSSPVYSPPAVEKKEERQTQVIPLPSPPTRPAEPVVVPTKQERPVEKSVMANKPTNVVEKKKEPTARQSSVPTPQMIRISPGSFMMGRSGENNEEPIHEVRLAKPFAIARYETTFDEYDRFAQATGRQLPDNRGQSRGQHPVTSVNWDDANAYAQWLLEQTGKHYRLPTEAEWEYAARSGGKDETWAGTSDLNQLKDYAVYGYFGIKEVGSKKPNGLGLYDMSGNAWEWVLDCLHDNYERAPTDGSAWLEADKGDCGLRVIRGGNSNSTPVALRASYRYWKGAGGRAYYWDGLGFRLVQDLP